jgi:hypothetical protein
MCVGSPADARNFLALFRGKTLADSGESLTAIEERPLVNLLHLISRAGAAIR